MKYILASVSLMTSTCVAPALADNAPITAWQPTDGAVIAFTVLRKGKPLGSHIVSFETSEAGRLIATIDVDLKVKVGPFTAFKYTLDSTETWANDLLVSVTGKTNDNGDKHYVEANVCDIEICVSGSEATGNAPIDIIPSSHWNIQQMYSDRMLSTESGALLEIDVEVLGRDRVSVGDVIIPANHYRLKSDIDVDLWYDDTGRWVKLAFEARGETIEYALNKLY